jgi:hypothetical protein
MNGRNQRRLWIALLLLCLIGAAAAIRRIVALSSSPWQTYGRYKKKASDLSFVRDRKSGQDPVPLYSEDVEYTLEPSPCFDSNRDALR